MLMNDLYFFENESSDQKRAGVVVITPVQKANHIMSVENVILFDALTFTFPCMLYPTLKGDVKSEDTLIKVLEALKLKVTNAEHINGKYNYTDCLQWTSEVNETNKNVVTNFLFGNFQGDKDYLTKNKYGEYTSCIEFSGGALRDLEYRYQFDVNKTWLVLDQLLTNIRAKVTRFDVAFDIIDSTTNIPLFLYEKSKKGLVVTPFQKFEYRTSFKGLEDSDLGGTLYLGSKQSDLFIRVYDKRTENHYKGVDEACFSHYRIEFQARHDKADELFSECMDKMKRGTQDLYEFILGLINRYIKPLKKEVNNNHYSDAEIDEKWTELFGSHECRLSVSDETKLSIEEKANWFIRSMAGMFTDFMLSMSNGFDPFMDKVLAEGLKKFDFKDTERIRKINSFRKSRQLEELDIPMVKNLLEQLVVERNYEDD